MQSDFLINSAFSAPFGEWTTVVLPAVPPTISKVEISHTDDTMTLRWRTDPADAETEGQPLEAGRSIVIERSRLASLEAGDEVLLFVQPEAVGVIDGILRMERRSCSL